MPINYINVAIVSARKDRSLVGLAAYIGRAKLTNDPTGESWDFTADRDDLVSLDVLLPLGAPPEFSDPQTLCLAAERAETVFDRKFKRLRYRMGAQFGKHVVIALDKGLTDAERRQVVTEWAQAQYVRHGVAVIVAIHKPDDPDTGNHHAHLIVTTRRVGIDGFAGKARHLNPRFARAKGRTSSYIESQNLPDQWRQFQNEFFRRNNIPHSVDPGYAVRGIPWRTGRFVRKNANEAADRATKEEARARVRDPAALLQEALAHQATFRRSRLFAILRQHGIGRDEATGIVNRALADPETLQLFDAQTGAPADLYTTRAVRDQEARILEAAGKLVRTRVPEKRLEKLQFASADLARSMDLSEEQTQAALHVSSPSRLGLIRGVAGAGKSYAMRAIREAHEEAGYRVVGLAPTNTVVAAMAVDGFSYATTLHSEQYRQLNMSRRYQPWDAKTCVMIDEAGMVDSEMMDWLLTSAAEAGAKVVLVGDQAQLTSVSRGGMFGILRSRFGAAELKEIRRQELDWSKAASLDLAEGRIEAGLKAYTDHGKVHWSNDLDDAVAALVARWSHDFRTVPDPARFVYCATNEVANGLNDQLQRVRFGHRTDYDVFDCDRGRIMLYRRDMVQFHSTDRSLGIMNGQAGVAVSVSADRIVVALQSGGQVEFDPRTFTGWGLGYAGTVYRGQGKTLPIAYALYDNVRSWSARATYVALTRHRQACDLFVPRTLANDLDTLGRQMSRHDDADASHAYLTAEEARVVFPRPRILARGEYGEQIAVDAADPASAPTLRCHWKLAPTDRFLRDYATLKKACQRAVPGSSVHAHLHDAVEVARERGIRPWDGRPDPRCLCDFIPANDGLVRDPDPQLVPERFEIDIRPIVVNIEQLEYKAWFALARRLRMLDHAVLQAILRRLDSIADRINTTRSLFSDINVARQLVRLSGLLKRRDANGSKRRPPRRPEFLAVRALDPTPRQTRGRFFLHRNDPKDGPVAVDLLCFISSRDRRAAVEREKQRDEGHATTVATRKPPAVPIASSAMDPQEHDERATLLGGQNATQADLKDGGKHVSAASLPAAVPPPRTANIPAEPVKQVSRPPRPRDLGPAL